VAIGEQDTLRRWMQHMARYVISDEYAPRYCAMKGEPYTDQAWLNALLNVCPRDQLLIAITAGTRAAGADRQLIADWTTYVLDHVDPDLAALLVSSAVDSLKKSCQ